MPQRINWKKGMRLSAELMVASDSHMLAAVRCASLVASNGRIGLYTAPRPFELSVNISDNLIEVVSLCCHGVTGSGLPVDIEFDSGYTNTFDTRVALPAGGEDDAFLLLVKIHEDEWREVDSNISELRYSFVIVKENAPVPDYCLPVGRIVNRYGWRLDEVEYCPPCLYVSAHRNHIDQLAKAKTLLRSVVDKCSGATDCVAKVLVGKVWSAASNAYIRLDQERDVLTPHQLLSEIQQFVNAFVVGCALEQYITLENVAPFSNFVDCPYDVRNVYRDIERGLAIAAEVSLKIDAVCEMVQPAQEPPVQPQPQPQPQVREEPKPRRKGWDGLSI